MTYYCRRCHGVWESGHVCDANGIADVEKALSELRDSARRVHEDIPEQQSNAIPDGPRWLHFGRDYWDLEDQVLTDDAVWRIKNS